jgi:hypothetical protein
MPQDFECEILRCCFALVTVFGSSHIPAPGGAVDNPRNSLFSRTE